MRKNFEQIDVYDLSKENPIPEQYASPRSVGEALGVEYLDILVSLNNSIPVIEGRYFLILTDECVKNRKFIITNQRNYFLMHHGVSMKRLQKERKRMYYIDSKKGKRGGQFGGL